MLRTAIIIPSPTAGRVPPRWRAWLRRAWEVLAPEGDERYLRDACDLADLERRLRCLERGRIDRFGPLPPVP